MNARLVRGQMVLEVTAAAELARTNVTNVVLGVRGVR